jgi:hypothetical protein
MTRTVLLSLLVLLPTAAAQADQTGSHSGLALSALVAAYSLAVPANVKTVMATLFDGNPAGGAKISIEADSIVCLAGDVAINRYSCDLTFGKSKVTVTGRKAHEIFATLVEVGIPSDGAAGKLYESLSHLKCTVDPNQIRQNDGGGVTCTFDPGPP